MCSLSQSPEVVNCQGVSLYHFAVKTFIRPFFQLSFVQLFILTLHAPSGTYLHMHTSFNVTLDSLLLNLLANFCKPLSQIKQLLMHTNTGLALFKSFLYLPLILVFLPSLSHPQIPLLQLPDARKQAMKMII